MGSHVLVTAVFALQSEEESCWTIALDRPDGKLELEHGDGRRQQMSPRLLHRLLACRHVLSEWTLDPGIMSLHRSLLSSLIRPLARHLQQIPKYRPFHVSACRRYEEDYEDPMDDPGFVKMYEARVFQEIKLEDYEELIRCPDDRKKVEEILKDYEFLKYTTDRAPTAISVKRMNEMMALTTPSMKMNYFNFLFKTEMKKLSNKRARARKGEAHLEMIRNQKDYDPGQLFDEETHEPIYRKWHNALFTRIRDTAIDAANDYKKQVAATFGQPFVVDFSFDQFMSKREIINTCDQLSIVYGLNYRQTPDIFDLHFCNYHKDTFMHERMMMTMPNLEFPNTMISLQKRSYLDIFPKEKLVYLTPHANNMLKEFSDDDVYIMAGLVDKTIKSPVSLAKAKKEGIRMARLPIDEHIIWGSYSKVLTLNQIVGIMLEVKNNGGNWKDAFLKYVPNRKLKTRETVAQEEVARLEKLTFKKKQFFKLR